MKRSRPVTRARQLRPIALLIASAFSLNCIEMAETMSGTGPSDTSDTSDSSSTSDTSDTSDSSSTSSGSEVRTLHQCSGTIVCSDESSNDVDLILCMTPEEGTEYETSACVMPEVCEGIGDGSSDDCSLLCIDFQEPCACEGDGPCPG